MSTKYTHLAAMFLLAAIVIFSNAQTQAGSIYASAVSATPGVARPPTSSCRVTLMTNQKFDSRSPKYLGKFNPPAGCPTPWAKLVLDWSGRMPTAQIDRLASLWIGGAEMFRGSTPFATLSGATWHVDKDVSEYSSILAESQNVTVLLPNPQGLTNPGAIYVNATLTFYEIAQGYGESIHPDAVVPLSASGQGSWFTLNDMNRNATLTVSLPTDIIGATLEVYATGHGCEEYWYATLLEGCPSGNPFREIQVMVDGQLSAVAWPFPNVYTGSCDAGLWRPIPSINSLNIPSYVVNLTPFAAQLSNGNMHTIVIQVTNNDGYWRVDANLLLYLDPQQSSTTGAITNNNLQAEPASQGSETVNGASFASINNESRSFMLSGYVDGSNGEAETTVQQVMSFFNRQVMDFVTLVGHVSLSAVITTVTTVSNGPRKSTESLSQTFTIDADCEFFAPQLLPDSFSLKIGSVTTLSLNESILSQNSYSDMVQAQSRRQFYNIFSGDWTQEQFTSSTIPCNMAPIGTQVPFAVSVYQSRPNLEPIAFGLIVGLVLLMWPRKSVSGLDWKALADSFLLYSGVVLMFAGSFFLLLVYFEASSLNVGLWSTFEAISPELLITSLGVLLFALRLRRVRR